MRRLEFLHERGDRGALAKAVEHDIGARRGERPGDAEPDAARRAGDDRRPADERPAHEQDRVLRDIVGIHRPPALRILRCSSVAETAGARKCRWPMMSMRFYYWGAARRRRRSRSQKSVRNPGTR